MIILILCIRFVHYDLLEFRKFTILVDHYNGCSNQAVAVIYLLYTHSRKESLNNMNYYRKRRKFRGVINFVVFTDATIPRNLANSGTRIDYNAKRSANSRQSRNPP